MTTLAIALKDEIRRLARKEIKAHVGHALKAVSRYRREIARLKREQRVQDRKIEFLEAQTAKSLAPQAAPNGNIRFSARSAKAQRRRTGLSAANYAKLIGVSPLTIYNWENGSSRPRQHQFGALVALRGIGKREAKTRLATLTATARQQSPKSRRRRKR